MGGWGLCVYLPHSLLSTLNLLHVLLLFLIRVSYTSIHIISLLFSLPLLSLFSLFSFPLLSLFSLPLLPPSPLLFPSPLPLLPLLPPFTTPKVNFNEPLSMLQRMVEDFIYSDILAKAASCDTTLEELTYVAAFATSCYAANRVNKPFNPMLGETYECDRRAELGWRCFMEQVRGCDM